MVVTWCFSQISSMDASVFECLVVNKLGRFRLLYGLRITEA